MAETLEIQVERSTDQKSITITDQTDWSQITGTIDSLTSIVIKFYTSSIASSDATYTFTTDEVSEYTSNAEITLTFETIFGSTYIADNWYIVQMEGNEDDYLSNYEGYGTYYYTKNKVYTQNVNGLNTPERDLSIMQPIHFNMISLKGLEELDNSNTLSRDIKFKKRLSALTKMLS